MPEKISEVINLLLLLIRWMGKEKISFYLKFRKNVN